MRIRERADSDYMLLEIKMEIEIQKGIDREKKSVQIEDWSVKECREYEENMKRRRETEGTLQTKWDELK